MSAPQKPRPSAVPCANAHTEEDMKRYSCDFNRKDSASWKIPLMVGLVVLLCVGAVGVLAMSGTFDALLGKTPGEAVAVSAPESPSPAEEPSGEPAPETAPDSVVRLKAVGDNLIHDSIYRQAAEYAGGNGYDFSPMYAPVAEEIADADLSYINQETIIAERLFPLSGYPMFNSPEAVGKHMVDIGFDVVSIANNHMFDVGEAGLRAALDFWGTATRSTAALRLGLAAQEERDHRVRLHRRGDSDAGGDGRSAIADGRLAVADGHYIAHLPDLHRVGAPPSGKSARRDELLARRCESRDQHHLSAHGIKRLNDNAAVREDFPRRGYVKPHVHGADVRIRLDAQEVLLDRLDLLLSDLVAEEELPVEVGLVHDVEVGDRDVLHARAHEMHRAVGAEPASARDADAHRLEQCPLPGSEIRVCRHLSLRPSS